MDLFDILVALFSALAIGTNASAAQQGSQSWIARRERAVEARLRRRGRWLRARLINTGLWGGETVEGEEGEASTGFEDDTPPLFLRHDDEPIVSVYS